MDRRSLLRHTVGITLLVRDGLYRPLEAVRRHVVPFGIQVDVLGEAIQSIALQQRCATLEDVWIITFPVQTGKNLVDRFAVRFVVKTPSTIRHSHAPAL